MPESLHIQTGDWISRKPEETLKLGAEVGGQVTGGEIFLVDGPLGAGKTVFVKGLSLGLDIDPDEVTSPSFTLVNPYQGRLTLFHIDLYRLDEGASAAHAVDLEELLGNERAVIVIEWAHRLGHYPLPDNVWLVSIEGDGDQARRISISKSDMERP